MVRSRSACSHVRIHITKALPFPSLLDKCLRRHSCQSVRRALLLTAYIVPCSRLSQRPAGHSTGQSSTVWVSLSWRQICPSLVSCADGSIQTVLFPSIYVPTAMSHPAFAHWLSTKSLVPPYTLPPPMPPLADLLTRTGIQAKGPAKCKAAPKPGHGSSALPSAYLTKPYTGPRDGGAHPGKTLTPLVHPFLPPPPPAPPPSPHRHLPSLHLHPFPCAMRPAI